MENKIQKTKRLVQQALAATSNISSKDCLEARSHLKHALKSLDRLQQKNEKKKGSGQKHFENWWGNVQSGIANSNFANVSQETHMKSLEKINALINAEQDKLNEIENNATQKKSTSNDQELITE